MPSCIQLISSTQQVEKVQFNGLIYRRYHSAKSWGDRNYFKRSSAKTRSSLHRDVWTFFFGPIPEGFEIHHKDQNTFNNEPWNLGALSKSDHQSHHIPTWRQRQAIGYKTSTGFLAMQAGRQTAVDWHKSEEGKRFHKQLGTDS